MEKTFQTLFKFKLNRTYLAAQSVLPCISLPTLKEPKVRCFPEVTTVLIGSLKSDGMSNSPCEESLTYQIISSN